MKYIINVKILENLLIKNETALRACTTVESLTDGGKHCRNYERVRQGCDVI